MSNILVLNNLSAFLLLFLLIAFHLITFSIFTPGLSFYSNLLSYESRIEFLLELKRNYLYSLKYLVPIIASLCLSFGVITVRIKLNSIINIETIFYICFFPWLAYYCIGLIMSFLSFKNVSWHNLNQLLLIEDIVFTFSNGIITIIGGTLAYLFNLVFNFF